MGAIAAAGPVSWFRADDLALADGAAVSSWVDRGSLGLNATQSYAPYQPQFKTGASPTGLPAIDFTGATVVERPLDSTATSGSSKQTILAVIKPTSNRSNSARTIVGAGGAGSGGLQFRLEATSNRLGLVKQGQQGLPVGSVGVNLTTFSVVAVTLDLTNGPVAFYVDGAAAGTGSQVATLNSTATLSLGAGQNGEWFQGFLAEVVRFDRVLTSAELADITAELRGRWIETADRKSVV